MHNLYTSNRKEILTISENGEEVNKNVSYILQLIDSAIFMTSSLSNLIKNLSEGIQNIKCEYSHDDFKCETCGIT